MSIFKRKNKDADINILLRYLYDVLQEQKKQREQIDFLLNVLLQSDLIEAPTDEQVCSDIYESFMKGDC